MISHGAAANLRERLFEQSDPFSCHVCTSCGFFSIPAALNTIVRGTSAHCGYCGTGEHVRKIRIPYAFKLMVHELMSLNIAPRLRVTAQGQADESSDTTFASARSEFQHM